VITPERKHCNYQERNNSDSGYSQNLAKALTSSDGKPGLRFLVGRLLLEYVSNYS